MITVHNGSGFFLPINGGSEATMVHGVAAIDHVVQERLCLLITHERSLGVFFNADPIKEALSKAQINRTRRNLCRLIGHSVYATDVDLKYGVKIPFKSLLRSQISRLICLPDRSGDFLTFKAKIARNNGKSEKTGFGMVNETALGRFFVFSGEKSRAPFGTNTLSIELGKK